MLFLNTEETIPLNEWHENNKQFKALKKLQH